MSNALTKTIVLHFTPGVNAIAPTPIIISNDPDAKTVFGGKEFLSEMIAPVQAFPDASVRT